MNDELRALSHVRDFAVNIESFLSTVVSFGGGLLWSFEIWKNRSAPSKHTGVSDVFSRFWNF